MAIAIIARWRMPPENSCGKDLKRTSGLGMPTLRSSSIARELASWSEYLVWTRSASTSWSPIV